MKNRIAKLAKRHPVVEHFFNQSDFSYLTGFGEVTVQQEDLLVALEELVTQIDNLLEIQTALALELQACDAMAVEWRVLAEQWSEEHERQK